MLVKWWVCSLTKKEVESTETQRLSTDENQGNRPGVALYGEINEKNISAKMTRIAK